MGVEANDLVRDNSWASHQNLATWTKDAGQQLVHAGY